MPCAVTQGSFSFLPDLTDEQIAAQVQYCARQGLGGEHRVHRRSASPQHLLGDVGPADVRSAGRRRRADGAERMPQDLSATATSGCRPSIPRHGWETVRLSFIVNRPKEEPGFRLERQEVDRPRDALHHQALRHPTGPRVAATVDHERRCHATADAGRCAGPSVDLRKRVQRASASARCSTSSTAS